MARYVIQTPPSANGLFVNRKNGGRFKSKEYILWIKSELLALTAQRARPIDVPVQIEIQIPKWTRGDIDNRAKPCLDLLVKAGVLADDSQAYVKRVDIKFADVQMTHVIIEPEAA